MGGGNDLKFVLNYRDIDTSPLDDYLIAFVNLNTSIQIYRYDFSIIIYNAVIGQTLRVQYIKNTGFASPGTINGIDKGTRFSIRKISD